MNPPGPTLCLMAVLLLSPGAWATDVEVSTDPGPRTGAAADRVMSDDADVVIVVSGEQGGRVGPCGCDRRPLGGLARQEAFVQALEAAGQPVLVLNAGGWLDARASALDIVERARAANDDYLRALRRVRVDVLNVAWPELATLDGRGRPGLVSATLHDDGTPVVDATVLDVAGTSVAVTGMTRPGRPYLMPEGTEVREGAAGVALALDGVDAALSVVMVYDDPKGARAVSELDGIDLVIDAARYNGRWPPLTDGALHVRTWGDGMRLTEIRLWLADGGGIARAHVREVDLDATLGTAWRGPPPQLRAASLRPPPL